MAQQAAPVLLVVLARLVASTWHEGECGLCGHGILGMAAPAVLLLLLGRDGGAWVQRCRESISA